MPYRLSWTLEIDRQIRIGIAAGQTWRQMEAAIGISRSALWKRARDTDMLQQSEPEDEIIVHHRIAALPAGHPRTWNALRDSISDRPRYPPGQPTA